MQLGMVGLGRMGGNMARRLIQGGHDVHVFDPNPDTITELVSERAVGAQSLEALVASLPAPRAVWVMVPDGAPTDETITQLAVLLDAEDVVIDGGNSNYKDSVRHAEELAANGIKFLDSGTSGGIWGLKEGYSLMVGGDEGAYRRLESIFDSLAPSATSGHGYVGPAGAGHFTKMIHNGIEYGMMQAFAEGFEILKAKKEFDLDLAQIAEIWREGSVVRSWLLDLTAEALKEDADLSEIQAYVDDSGEGRWTVQESIELRVPAPVITASLQARFRSRQDQPFGAKMLAAMRNAFGGHAIKRSGE
ncbi:MAG: decarboxylating 6-phosphogluconate dehydrogenase [Chloroflexi bacterium]|nr:decarboxylating 6-phosphogluconate dehydrogenase [Chloroflexota bacterium]